MSDTRDPWSDVKAHEAQIAAQRWLSVADLAQRWGVSRPMVRKVSRGELPYITLGSSEIRRYDPADVQAFEQGAKRGEVA